MSLYVCVTTSQRLPNITISACWKKNKYHFTITLCIASRNQNAFNHLMLCIDLFDKFQTMQKDKSCLRDPEYANRRYTSGSARLRTGSDSSGVKIIYHLLFVDM
ncbi:hypothetical protein CBL_07325 [Carabus blaptoides fortunei]